MRYLSLLAIAFVLQGEASAQRADPVSPAREPLSLREVAASAEHVPLCEKLELTVDLGATYDNPYDPDQVRLDAVFTAPSGKAISVPGFFLVPQRREIADGNETMTPAGAGQWKVRFAPTETGRYTWRLALADRTGQITGGEGAFAASPGKRPGFVRTSRVDPHYFAFDNGEGYFAVGHAGVTG